MKLEDILTAIQGTRIRITDHADEEVRADRLSYEEVYFSVFQGEIMV